MKLASIFTDGAVLQRNKTISIWGETVPGVLVRAELAGQEGYAKSSRGGGFLIQLAPLDAGGPFELKISVTENPEESVILKDVFIGDVWLCSGQSNMQYTLGSRWAKALPEDGSEPVNVRQEKEFLDSITKPETFRFITVPMIATGCREPYFEGSWRPIDRENASAASAVAAWFGRKLRDTLNIPVGLICCSWGGSKVETWISPSSLKGDPETREMLEAWETWKRGKALWTEPPITREDFLSRYATPNRENKGFEQGWADPALDDSSWTAMQVPGSWINQGIAGNGAVWIRKKVCIPESLAGKELVLHLGGVDKHDTTYFNGIEVGRTGKDLDVAFFDKPRCYTIPGNLVRPGENTLAIRGYSFAWDGAFMPPADAYTLDGPDFSLSLAGEWKAKAEVDFGRLLSRMPYGFNNVGTPGMLFDSMVRPLLPASIRGVIWYQGESNTETIAAAGSYRKKMGMLIRDWRFQFEQPDLPILQVQLADYREASDYDDQSTWAVLRDTQLKVCGDLPDVHLITALDTGEENDIHPQNKKEIGRRLAASALHHVYGKKDILPCGPEFVKAQPEGKSLRVFFRYAEGMTLHDHPGKSFYLAGADRKFYPADNAGISGDSLVLNSEKVEKPLYVRYAWSYNPVSILFNREFPAAAFTSEE
ncbi:MAG: hypothetical protein J5944_06820 [Lentisphaeria bacterium]|nr:hypothetical protein [Lentisphaeria bacterium]